MNTEEYGLLWASRPPYVAFKTFQALLQRVAKEEIPARIDSALLARWGIAAGNEPAMRTSLKALGLIDDDGRPSGEYVGLRLSAPRRREVLRRCAEHAYPGLGEPLSVDTDGDLLRDYFAGKRRLHGQMVGKAISFYRGLAREAGPESITIESGTSDNGQASTVSADLVESGGRISLTMAVQIPFGVDEDDLVRYFQRIQRAWRRAQER